MSLNETFITGVTILVDNTIGCSDKSPNMLLLYMFAIFGLLNVTWTLIQGTGSSLLWPLVYVYGFIKWIHKRLKEWKSKE